MSMIPKHLMSEEDIKLQFITPAVTAKWDISKITMEKIGCKIDLQFIDAGSFQERMNMNMAAGADFDICFTSGWLNDYHLAVQRGGLMPLDALMESTPALKAEIPDYAWETAKVNGEIYAVPNMQIMTYANTQYVLKRLADKYGFDPESYNHVEDLEEFLAKVKAGEDFDKLAKKFNEDPGMETSPEGYVFTTGEMVPEFEEASLNLAVGEYDLEVLMDLEEGIELEHPIYVKVKISAKAVLFTIPRIKKSWKG